MSCREFFSTHVPIAARFKRELSHRTLRKSPGGRGPRKLPSGDGRSATWGHVSSLTLVGRTSPPSPPGKPHPSQPDDHRDEAGGSTHRDCSQISRTGVAETTVQSSRLAMTLISSGDDRVTSAGVLRPLPPYMPVPTLPTSSAPITAALSPNSSQASPR